MNCETCKIELTRETALELGDKPYCSTCFFRVAEAFRQEMTPEQRKMLRELVRDELEGVLPRGPIRDVIVDGIKAIMAHPSNFDEEVSHIVNQVERIAGLCMFREILKIIEALSGTLGEQEDEVRSKMRKLGKL